MGNAGEDLTGIVRSESLSVTMVESTCFINNLIDSFSSLASAASSFFNNNFCCWICSSNKSCFLRRISIAAFLAASFFIIDGAGGRVGFFSGLFRIGFGTFVQWCEVVVDGLSGGGGLEFCVLVFTLLGLCQKIFIKRLLNNGSGFL